MSEPRPKRQRVTPRNSNANEQIAPQVQTPYANLRQLASLVQRPAATPFRRAASAGPGTTPATGRSNNVTPGTGRTPKSGGRQGLFTRPVIARRGPPTTPHAIRALQQRRNAALTPGKSRRRSGRMQRETPRDTLRALSRLLAPKSKPIVATPGAQKETSRSHLLDDLEDDPDPRAPRLSMALDFESDDDEDGPPRLSALPDDLDPENLTANLTAASLETGRRAVSEDPRFSRRSLGRLSERFPGLNDLSFDAGGPEIDGTFIRGNVNLLDDDEDILIEDGTINLGDENTAELRALMDTARRQVRHSDLDIPGLGDEDDEPTFQFRIAPRDRLSQPVFTRGPAGEDFDEAPADLLQDDDGDLPARQDHDEERAFPGFGFDDPEASDLSEPEQQQALRADFPTQGPKLDSTKKKQRRKKELKLSRHGIEYPSLPTSVVKKVATSFARLHGSSNAKINKETLAAITEASDWFFEQVGEDLGAYAEHAGRKTIEDGDVIALMKRQRQLNTTNTPFSLAQKYLPRELLQDIRMPPPGKLKKRKRQLETIEEEEE